SRRARRRRPAPCPGRDRVARDARRLDGLAGDARLRRGRRPERALRGQGRLHPPRPRGRPAGRRTPAPPRLISCPAPPKRVFDTAKGVGHTESAMMAHATGTFTTPATGIVVVTITILPL